MSDLYKVSNLYRPGDVYVIFRSGKTLRSTEDLIPEIKKDPEVRAVYKACTHERLYWNED